MTMSQAMNTHDTSELISLQVTQFEKEKKDINSKLKTLAKKIDHTERAYRLVFFITYMFSTANSLESIHSQ